MEYYIYTLSDPISNEIRYVGKTKNLKDRLSRHMNPSNLKNLWTPKSKWLKYLKNNNLKPIMEILDIGDENNIDDLEIYWISQLNTWGLKLKNITKGGVNPNPKGEKLREEHIESLIKSCTKRKPIDKSCYFLLQKKVIQYTIENVYINEFESIAEAERQTGFKHISDCCRNLRHRVGDYYFRYSDNYFPYIEKENYWLGKKHKKESIEKMKMNHPFRKDICQYELNSNKLVCEYKSSHEAEEICGFLRKHIVESCKNESVKVNKYYFRYKDNYFPYKKSKNDSTILYVYDNDILIKKYNSYNQAKKDGYTPQIIKNILDTTTTYHNYFWRTC